jgi:hypothetical protein
VHGRMQPLTPPLESGANQWPRLLRDYNRTKWPPSLLDAIWLQFGQALTSNAVLRLCGNCGKQTMINRMTEIVLSGFYLDRIVRSGGRFLFKERLCIYDSLLLPTSLIAPV